VRQAIMQAGYDLIEMSPGVRNFPLRRSRPLRSGGARGKDRATV